MGLLVSRVVFQPPSSKYAIDYKTYTVVPSKHGYRIPVTTIFHKNPRFVVLYSHGNSENIQQVHQWCEVLSARLRVTVFAYDYRGYGPTKGTPTEQNVFSDALVVYNYVKKFHPDRHIVLFGRSLGCAPSIKLAGVVPARGLVLESPFLTCVKTVLNTGFTLWFDMFRNETNIQQCTQPTLIIHGKEDRVVPFEHGVTLFKDCPNPWGKLWLEKAGHNDIDSIHREELLRKVSYYLDDLELQDGSARRPIILRTKNKGL